MRHGRKREHRLGFAVCVYYGTPGGCQHWKRMAGVYRGSRWIYEDCIDDDIDDDDVDSDETLYPLCKQYDPVVTNNIYNHVKRNST